MKTDVFYNLNYTYVFCIYYILCLFVFICVYYIMI